MNNVIKILFAAILIFISFLWLSTLFKSCNKPKSIIGNIPEEVETTLPSDNFFEEDASLNDSVSYFEDDNTVEEKNIYDEIDRIAEERQKSENSEKKSTESESVNETEDKKVVSQKPENKKNTETKPNTGINTNDKFMVITASFLLEKNADDAVQKLKKVGFSKAEKVVFDNSEYYSTLAGRASSLKQAEELLTKLKQNGYKDARIIEKK